MNSLCSPDCPQAGGSLSASASRSAGPHTFLCPLQWIFLNWKVPYYGSGYQSLLEKSGNIERACFPLLYCERQPLVNCDLPIRGHIRASLVPSVPVPMDDMYCVGGRGPTGWGNFGCNSEHRGLGLWPNPACSLVGGRLVVIQLRRLSSLAASLQIGTCGFAFECSPSPSEKS